MGRKKIAKQKLEIVFDPQKRKEFLTGFSKRKNERRNKAKEELEKRLKNERKIIRAEVSNSFKHLKKSFQGLKELTEEDKLEDEYEDDDVKVKIVELTTNELADKMNFLGENRVLIEEKDNDDNKDNVSDQESENDINRIPGMDYVIPTKNLTNSSDDEATSLSKNKNEIKSKKELNKLTKLKMNAKMKKSKIFKIKGRIEKKANQKQARRDKNNMIRGLPKKLRKLKRLEPSRYRKGKLVNKKEIRRKKDFN